MMLPNVRTCVHTDERGTCRYFWTPENGPRFDSDEWIEYIPPAFERPRDHKPYWMQLVECERCGDNPRQSCFTCK